MTDKNQPQTIFYARVSTTEQTISHQAEQAKAAGFKIDEVISDEGVSGVSVPLAERPEGKRLFDLLRRGDTLVVRWVDQLGRNYTDVTDTMRVLLAKGVIIKTVINGMVFDGDTTDPMQQAVRDAMIAFMAAMAEANAATLKIAQKAGIDHAKGNPQKYLGRKPSYNLAALQSVEDLLGKGQGASAVARETGLSRATVIRIKDDLVGAYAALERWGT
jgi:putative DNA-invertase from lambdoid prophage Rac